MMGENVRMAHPLLNGCAQELREFQCMPSSQFSGSPNFHLSWVLLCLENAARLKPARLSGKCQHEMLTHRKLMMSEFRLSPEVVMSCGRVSLFWSFDVPGGMFRQATLMYIVFSTSAYLV